jgi:hypothetical protein
MRQLPKVLYRPYPISGQDASWLSLINQIDSAIGLQWIMDPPNTNFSWLVAPIGVIPISVKEKPTVISKVRIEKCGFLSIDLWNLNMFFI